MTWLEEYKTSLKNLRAEEFLDIYLFRPFAFIIVKLFYRFPLTPNHYSLMSFIAGMSSAYLFYQGAFGAGAAFFLLFAVLDCCDGMQARLKKNGSEFGRLVDGFVDYSCNAACYICLALGTSKYLPLTWSIPTAYLVVAAGVSKAIHSMMYDHYLMEYLSYERGNAGFVQREIENIRERLNLAKQNPNESKIRIFILWVYLGFSSLQAGDKDNTPKFNSREYVEKNYVALQLWSLIGPAWHILILSLAFLFQSPGLLFVYAIAFANLWMLVMLAYQKKIFQDLSLGKAVS